MPPSPTSAPRRMALRPLGVRDFRLLMLDTTLQNVVMPINFITLTFWAASRYPDQKVLYPSLLLAIRGVGLLAFSPIGGALADRLDKRRVIQCCETVLFLLIAGTAACMLFEPLGDGTILLVLGLVFLQAANMGFDAPTRASSIAAIVPKEEMGAAIGLNNIAQQLTIPIVLPVVGLLNGAVDAGYIIAASLLAWVGIFPAIASLRFVSRGGSGKSKRVVADIREGIAYVRKDQTIQGIVLLVLVLQVVAMPGVGMLGPVWMTQVLGLSKAQFGLVAMVWGIGAFCSSFYFARNLRSARSGRTMCILAIVFGLFALVFSYSRIPLLTAAANFVLGFSLAGTLVVAITVVQYKVADEMRGRVMGLFPLIMGVSMLNVLPVGAAGQRLGLELIVPAMSWAALALAAYIITTRGSLRRTAGALSPSLPVQPRTLTAGLAGDER